LQHVQRGAFGGVADGDDRDRGGGRGRVGHEHGETFDTGGPADAGGVGAAHLLDQAVIAAAAHHRALGAETVGDELEGGVAVIVEAADDARVLAEWHGEAGQVVLELRVEGGGLGR